MQGCAASTGHSLSKEGLVAVGFPELSGGKVLAESLGMWKWMGGAARAGGNRGTTKYQEIRS